MKHILPLSLAFFILPSIGHTQDVLFDEPHADDLLLLKTVHGEEVLVNSDGKLVEVHPVFKMPLEERKAKGITISNSVADSPNYRQDGSDGNNFNLTYLEVVNETGQGFDHPVLGESRRAALEAAFNYLSISILDEGVADIVVRESYYVSPNSPGGKLGNGNPMSAASVGFNQPLTLRHIVSGSDPTSQYPDGYISFNFHESIDYNYDTNRMPSDEFDFFTVALHEVIHILGVGSWCNAQGETSQQNETDAFSSFDEYLLDFEKHPLLELQGTDDNLTVSKPDAGLLTNNQVWFDLGPGEVVPIFSPASFNESSLSHFDNGRTNHGEYVMHPSLSRGDAFRHLHEDEVRVLEVLGYTMNYSLATSIGDGTEGGPLNGAFSGLYPNPANPDYGIQIDIPELNTPEILVIVYDMMGRESYSKVVINQGAGPVTAIDPYNNLSPGMYIVVGSSKDELFNEKLIIQ